MLLPIIHKGKEQILMQYGNIESLNQIARRIKGVKWSQTQKSWYVPLTKDNYETIRLAFEPYVYLETSALKSYLQKRNQVSSTKPFPPNNAIPAKTIFNIVTHKSLNTISKEPKLSVAFDLSQQNLTGLQKMMDHLTLKAYSLSTMRTYRGEMLVFMHLLGKHAADALTTDDVKRYLLKCITEGISENTIHSRINALKFYYEQVLGREKFFVEIPRPKKPFLLPRFFNQDEITAIINCCGNLKQKVMLMLAYSGGLRVSEVVAMLTRNIDSKRMSILIEKAKGKKDRLVTLSPVLLVMLREYWNAYKPAKAGYLFSGQNPDEPYSVRSLQMVLQAAKEKAGILKPGGVHALRHSFATHLLDKGTDIMMIMKLLGHNDIKTTLRYLHVTNRDMLQIISPLDNLDIK